MLVLLLAPFFTCRAYALEPKDESADVFHLESMCDGLSGEEREISGELSAESYDAEGAMRRLGEELKKRVREEVHGTLRFASSLTALCFLGGFACALCEDETIRAFSEICVCCAAAALLTGSMDSLIRQTMEALYRLSDYSKAALPVVFTAAAASGAAASAAARYAAVSFALDVLMSLAQRFILPLVNAYLALTLTGALFPNSMLKAAARFARWVAGILLTGTSLVFTAYIGVSGAISSAVNAAAVKATKTLISTALPVVGGMISDASAMVLSAAGVVRSCAGAFGLISVCAICLGPFVLLSVKTLLFKAVSVLAEAVPCGRLSGLLSGVSEASAMLMGLLGSCAVMLFLSFSVAMKAVTV
ncbi:MAG: stage III sporulation protein AE [Oscillospiraceae bacterium]|nr:stage III sporulation protein AE [Oscillospiraceae bacterium]